MKNARWLLTLLHCSLGQVYLDQARLQHGSQRDNSLDRAFANANLALELLPTLRSAIHLKGSVLFTRATDRIGSSPEQVDQLLLLAEQLVCYIICCAQCDDDSDDDSDDDNADDDEYS